MVLRVRSVTMEDLPRCAAIEEICFPAAQAASRQTIEARIRSYPGHILAGVYEDEIVGYVMGPVIDRLYIEDEMFADTACHSEENPYQAVFALAVVPAFQRRGIGGQLLHAMVELARKEGRRAVTLTCLQEKIRFYEALGFVNHGISASVHGGVQWYNMVREL